MDKIAPQKMGSEHRLPSLVGTCKLNGVKQQAYLIDVITRIVARHR